MTYHMKSFDHVFTITDRQLGSGVSGHVLMAVDHHKRRQVACKIVYLKDILRKQVSHQVEPNSPNFQPGRTRFKSLGKETVSKLWREVELLKELSHVGRLNHDWLKADKKMQPNIIRIEQVLHTRDTM